MSKPARIQTDEQTEVRLHPTMCDDVWNIYHKIPNIQVARAGFSSIVFCAPFKVTTKSLPLKLSEEVEVLVDQHWVKYNQDVYDWLKMFGLCPYYLERVGQSVHKVPVVPPYGTGYITTYLKSVGRRGRKKQAFKWYWDNGGVSSNGKSYDRDVHFELSAHLPSIRGELLSPISSLIADYRALSVIRDSNVTANYQSARPIHLFEHHPPKNGTVDNHLVSLEFAGERAAGTMLEEVERMTQRKAQIKTSDLMASLMESAMHNKRINGAHASGPFKSLSKDRMRQMDIENPGVYSRSFPLRADYKYVQSATPKLLSDYQKLEKHIDAKAASVMDFPLELIQPSSSARGASNVQGNIRYFNEQIKSTLKFFTRLNKKVFIQVYGSILQGRLDRYSNITRSYMENPENMMNLLVENEIIVEMQCNPIISVQDIQQLYAIGIMDKQTMAEHSFAQYALPLTQITLSEPPEMGAAPTKQKKRSADVLEQDKPPKKKKKPEDDITV